MNPLSRRNCMLTLVPALLLVRFATAIGAAPQEEVWLIKTTSDAAVLNQPLTPTTFRLDQPMALTMIFTYHWNYGQGMAPGRISLRHEDGTVYGPWPAVPSYKYWVVNFIKPGEASFELTRVAVTPQCPVLKPGRYTVVDSSPQTWSQNAETGYMGITLAKGVRAPLPAAGLPSTTGKQPVRSSPSKPAKAPPRSRTTPQSHPKDKPATSGVPTRPPYRLTSLVTRKMRPGDAPVSIRWKNAVAVIVPAGAVKQPDELRLSTLQGAPPPTDRLARHLAVYDISFTRTRQLEKPLTLEFAYDASRQKAGTFTWVSYWDDRQRIWVTLPSEIDREKKVVRARTDHLCPVSVTSAADLADYQQREVKPADADKWYYANDYFVMIYGLKEVTAATCDAKNRRGFKALIDPEVPVIRDDLPAYPEQVWDYVNRFREEYCAAAPEGAGFRDLRKFEKSGWIDTSGTMVHVTGDGSSGRSKISGDLTVTLAKTGYPGLKAEVAHELFHCVQGRYYTAAGMTLRKWWMEATADYACEKVAASGVNVMGGDRINPRFLEVPLMYSSSVIYDAAQAGSAVVAEGLGYRSDAILKEDPHGYHEYTAAYFIDFLVQHRKINFKEMFEAVAASYNPGVASPLDAFLKTRGTSLDECYAEFARWWVFDPGSPLYTRHLVGDIKEIAEPSVTAVMPSGSGMISRTMTLAADRTARLWCFSVEPEKKSGRPREIAVTVRGRAVVSSRGRAEGYEETGTGWTGYLYLLKQGQVPREAMTPVAVLDPGEAGRAAKTATFTPHPDEQVCLLLVNLNPGNALRMEMEAALEFPYRSCDTNFLVQGPARTVAADTGNPGDPDRNWTKMETASLGNVIADGAAVFMQGDEFTVFMNLKEYSNTPAAKVQLKGRFDKDRQMIEELTVRWDLDYTLQQPTTVVRQHWVFRARNIPRHQSPWRNRHEFVVDYDLKSDEPPEIPPGFAVTEATYLYKSTATHQGVDPPRQWTDSTTKDQFGKPTHVSIHLTFTGDPPKVPRASP